MVQQPTPLGEGFTSCADITGPASYANPGGQVVSAKLFALQTIRYADGSMIDSTGTNYAVPVAPSGPGAATIVLRWFVAATGAEVANATNLSTKEVRMSVWGN